MNIVTINYCPKCGRNTAKDGVCSANDCKYNARHIKVLTIIKERQI